MARTPLLRAFRRLAEEHRSAERLGIPPAELRGRREEAALSRREFLKRAGVTGAAIAVAGPAALAERASAATAPRRSPTRSASLTGWTSGLRNARNSYHSAAQCVNRP